MVDDGIQRATLQALQYPATAGEPKPVGDVVVVQFNPTSLRIERRNNVNDNGKGTKTAVRTVSSVEYATLSLDLIFDTAEQGTDVRVKTLGVRQFIQPPKNDRAKAPPNVRFTWGALTFDGILTQITEELDYFSAAGVALHAKLSLTFGEALPAQLEGPPVRDDNPAKQLGAAAAGALGTSGTLNPIRVVAAQAGESVQQMLSRLNLDPAGWRSAMNGLQSPIALAAGTQVQLGADVSASTGIGASAGFAAGAQVGVTAELSGALAGVQADPTAAGFALAAGGGVAQAQQTVLASQTGSAEVAARSSFAVPVGQTESTVDARSLTYGSSIPLRARADAETTAQMQAGGQLGVTARARAGEVPVASSPSMPPWQQLPPSNPVADSTQRTRDARPTTMRWRPGGECR
ncbi:CIS tube protein [Kutzneria sp. CA-103260]|uniref:CIS tube protein n=1 Tax=Kutzneria sp. CA-103260 TaxID=2802641 RepID=UPI001BACFF0B|nr:hypothetical protein [Kutzneria sp. CA-103260]QUQ63878.1 hypothetical protein JJ691_15950 [Kutzneria sp. CA-103260]